MHFGFFASLIVGTVLGFLAGIGVGGGSLLILWLTAVVGMPADQARVRNLMFFLPPAVIACYLRWRKGTLQPGKLLPAIIAGCAAAGALSMVSRSLDGRILDILFAVLLLATGLRELFYRPRKAR